MITNDIRWSLSRGSNPVPSPLASDTRSKKIVNLHTIYTRSTHCVHTADRCP
jgi:hypothetical protein